MAIFAVCAATACESTDVADPVARPGVLATGFWIPDGLAVIGEDEFLFADRSGSLHHYLDGGVTTVTGLPPSRTSGVYGGLLDVSLHPRFDQNRLVYIAYNDATWDLTVARFEFDGGRARHFEILFASTEFSIGSRIEWQDESHFFLSFGVGGDPYPDPGPQDLDSDVGKIHRLTADGLIPADNPVFPGSNGPSSVWSYGHRNPQGLHFDAIDEVLYATEHGPLGGDELNVVIAGANYGWPLFSYGLNYDRTPVSSLTEEAAASQSRLPLKYWGPDFRVAPSGLLMADGVFLLGALNPQDLLRYDPATDRTDVLMRDVGRVRDVAALPSGMLLIAVDEGSPRASDLGRILRITRDGEVR